MDLRTRASRERGWLPFLRLLEWAGCTEVWWGSPNFSPRFSFFV